MHSTTELAARHEVSGGVLVEFKSRPGHRLPVVRSQAVTSPLHKVPPPPSALQLS